MISQGFILIHYTQLADGLRVNYTSTNLNVSLKLAKLYVTYSS